MGAATVFLKSAIGILSLSVVILAYLAGHQLSSPRSFLCVGAWSVAQWIPVRGLRRQLEEFAWQHWETKYEHYFRNDSNRFASPMSVPVVNVHEHGSHLLEYLERNQGKDWRKRPLLLKSLWSTEDLEDPSRRLSLSGLLGEELSIPYFVDATKEDALTPDGRAPVKDIVANITRGKPHKIGTQIIVEKDPELIREVAPVDVLTDLFGNYFTPGQVRGWGPFRLLPALTTVPVFVAAVMPTGDKDYDARERRGTTEFSSQPYTALHSEPIGNVAVQLSGRKRWTLIQPEYSFLIKPSTAPDGRAFFASFEEDYSRYPRYSAETGEGDAMWIPPWTWHRVDYTTGPSEVTADVNDRRGRENIVVAIGGSLFHFRPMDFVRNNPLFALLIVPALIRELIGYSTQ